MWSGDWHNLPQETLCLLRKSEECRTYLEEAQHDLYTLGNEEDDSDISRIVRVACLQPYLFGHSFFNKESETWARSSGIYQATIKVTENELNREVREIIVVLDTLAYHVSLLMRLTNKAVSCAISHLSDEQQDLLDHFDEQTSYTKVVSLVKPSDIYSIFRKKLKVTSLKEEQVLGCFLIALKAALAHSKGSQGTMLSRVLEEHRKNDKGSMDELKNSGNQKFKDKKYKEAYALYTDAITKTRYSHLLYSNRAQCLLRLQRYSEAEMDARRTIILCPNFEKGYYKMVQVFDGQQQHTQALQVLDFYSKRCHILNLNISPEMQELQMKVTENSGKPKNGKVENSTPKLIKPKAATHIPVPDLLSESDSDSEDVNKAVKKEPDVKEPTIMEASQCSEIIQKASEDLVEGLYKSALHGYRQVLTAKTTLQEFDLVFIKYAAGHACLQMGSLDDLNEAIRLFTDAVNNNKKVVFPLAYHGLAQAHIKMNRYAEAQPYITKGLDIINKGIFFKEAITWPGTKRKVEMRDKASLKKSFEELQGVCKAPPKPNAKCCGEECPMHRNIYYTDPDFKGFQQLHCRSKCLIQYHPSCWKMHKERENLTEKGFLGNLCPTPDCKDIIIEIETIEKDGTVGRHFIHADYDKENMPKQKKTKKEKKQEQRELKKRQRRDTNAGNPTADKEDDVNSVANAGCDTVNSTHGEVSTSPTELGKQDPLKSENKATIRKESTSEEPKPPAGDASEIKTESPAADAPYVLKREDEEDLPDVKNKKCKDKKKRSRGILTIDIAPQINLYSQYEQRIARLVYEKNVVEDGLQWGTFCETERERYPGLDPSRPFFIPEQLRDNETALEAVLQHRGGYLDKEGMREIRENVYQYLQDFLLNNGPCPIDDPSLLRELESFPPEARELVDSVGGLFNFILQSMRFYVDGDMIHAYPHRSAYTSGETSPVNAISTFEPLPQPMNVGKYDIPPLLASSDDEYESDASGDERTAHPAEVVQEHELTQRSVPAISSYLNPSAEGFSAVPPATESPSPNSLMHVTTPSIPPLTLVPPENAQPAQLGNVSRPACLSSDSVAKEGSRPRSKNAAVVVQNLLPTLSQRHLSDCVIAALSCLEKDVSEEMLSEINKKLQSCQLVSSVEKRHSSVQVDMEPEKESLQEQYLQLQAESSLLKEQLDNALDANCKLQRKFTLDMGQAKEKLDEVTAELQESKESWKKTRIEMETEIKRLQQEKQKMKELKDELKSAKSANGNSSAPDSFEKVVSELSKERSEHQELQENFRLFQEAADRAVDRAKVAEIHVLGTALKWAKDRHDSAVMKAKKALRDLERIPILPTSDYRYTSEVARGKEHANAFIRDWDTIYSKFEEDVNIHIDKLKDGATLASLPTLDMPNKPEFNYVPPMPPLPPPPPLHVNGHRLPGQLMPQPFDPARSHPFIGNGLLPKPYFLAQPPLPPPQHYMMPAGLPRPPVFPDSSGARSKTVTSGPPPGLQDKSANLLRGASSASSIDSMDDITGDSATLKSAKQPAGASRLTQMTAAGSAPLNRSATNADGNKGADHALDDLYSIGGQPSRVHVKPPAAHVQQQALARENSPEPKSQPKRDRSQILMMRLEAKFPDIPQEDIVKYLKEVRMKKNGLTGMTISEIIDQVTEIVDRVHFRAPHTMSRLTSSSEAVRGTLRPMRPPPEPASSEAARSTRRMWATQGNSESQQNWDGKNSQCSICLEELDGASKQVTNSCGHTFHESCIQDWYKNDHTCPNCRAHSLPETDFPSLGK